MHRSGTSAVTRVLNLLGAELPQHLMPPAEGNNPRGFWESQELVVLHDEMLRAGRSSWDDWTRLDSDWLDTAIAGRFRARLLALLDANFGRSCLFVIKDPRMCRLIPLWRSVLQEFGATVRVVIPVRNPIEVAASLTIRDGFSTAWSMLIWLRHVIDAERETRDLPRSIIRFGELLNDRTRILATMRRRLAIRWPRSLTVVGAEIEAFLSAAERHHSADNESLDSRRDVSPLVSRAYQALSSIARDGENGQAHAELDQIGTDLDLAAITFGSVVADQATANNAKAAETDTLRSSLEAQTVERETVQRELAVVGAELTAVRAGLAAAHGDVAHRIAESERLAEELSAIQATLEERSRELVHFREALASSETSARASRLAVDALREALGDRECEAQRLRQQLDEVRAQLDYMLDSFSWRVTAPLRGIRGRF